MQAPSVFDATAIRSQGHHRTAALSANSARIAQHCVTVNDSLDNANFVAVNNVLAKTGFSVQCKTKKHGAASSPHPVVNAFKAVAISVIEYNIRRSPAKNIGASSKQILDIRNYTHCCQITLDGRQEARNQATVYEADRLLKNKVISINKARHARRVIDFFVDGKPYKGLCNKGSQNCFAQAYHLVGIDSIYDITPEQLELTFIRSQARVGYFTMLAPPPLEAGCNFGNYGEINWKTYTPSGRDLEKFETPKKGHRIAFAFSDPEDVRTDGSAGYEHDAHNFQRWLHMGAYQGQELNYFIERQYFGPVALLTIRACKLGVTVPRILGTGHSRTRFPDVETLVTLIGDSYGGSNERYHDLATTFFEKIMSYAMSRDNKIWNFANFASYVRAQAITVTIAGTDVLGFDRDDVKKACRDDVILSLWFQACLKRRNAAQLEKKIEKMCARIEATGTAQTGLFALFTRLGNFIQAAFFAVVNAYMPGSEADHIVTKTLLNKLSKVKDGATMEKFTTSIKSRFKIWYSVNTDMKLLTRSSENMAARLDTVHVDSACTNHNMVADRYVSPQLLEDEIDETTEKRQNSHVTAFAKASMDEYRITIAPKEANNSRKIIACGNDTMHEVIVAASEYILSHDANFNGEVRAILGGPGTGKTHHIINNLENNDVILCATAEAKEDIEASIAVMAAVRQRSGMASISGLRVFTPHSLVKYIRDRAAGNSLIKPNTLWSDEAFLNHPGLTLMCAAWLGVDVVNIVGDEKQIAHKDFEIGDEEVVTYMRWNHIVQFVNQTILRDNYRLPDSHVHAVNARWGYDMVPKSGRAGKCELRKFATVKDAISAASKDSFVITKQNVHAEMARNSQLNCRSTHRAQGTSKDHVTVIITTDHVEQFNEDPGYLIVSLTRHRENLSIFMVDGDYAAVQLPNESAGTIEAFLDLSVAVAPLTIEKPRPRQADTIPIADRMGHRPNCLNLDFDVLEQDLLDLGICTNRFGEDMEDVNSINKLNNAAPACVIKIKPNKAAQPADIVRCTRLSSQAIFQHQEANNIAYAIYTWCTRNAGGRTLPNANVCIDKIPAMFGNMLDFYYDEPRGRVHLTAEQLQEGLIRVIRNIQIRGKTPAYKAIIDELYDLDAVKGFIKEQTKVKVSPDPNDADFYDSLCTAMKTYQDSSVLQGKAGQGVAAWSKARNLMMGGWINAIEEAEIKTLRPWVLHATGMDDATMCSKIEEIMNIYGFCICIKGDDTFVAALVNGKWKYYCSDQSQFDTSFSSVHYTLEAERYRSYGMPEHLIFHNKQHAMKYNLIESNGVLQMLNILCGNCSGKPQTLSLNSFVSMAILHNSLNWQKGPGGRPVDFTVDSRLRTATENLFGVKIKVESGDVASFVGFLIKDAKVVPDLMRTSGKFLSRRIFTNTTVPADVKLDLIDQGYKKEELAIARTVTEMCIALRDRMKSIDSEAMKIAVVDINAQYYFPERPAGPIRRLERVLSFLQNAASFEHIRFFVKRYLERVHDFHVFYENNEAPLPSAYYRVPADETEELFDDLTKIVSEVSESRSAGLIREAEQTIEELCMHNPPPEPAIKTDKRSNAADEEMLQAHKKFIVPYTPTDDELSLELVNEPSCLANCVKTEHLRRFYEACAEFNNRAALKLFKRREIGAIQALAGCHEFEVRCKILHPDLSHSWVTTGNFADTEYIIYVGFVAPSSNLGKLFARCGFTLLEKKNVLVNVPSDVTATANATATHAPTIVVTPAPCVIPVETTPHAAEKEFTRPADTKKDAKEIYEHYEQTCVHVAGQYRVDWITDGHTNYDYYAAVSEGMNLNALTVRERLAKCYQAHDENNIAERVRDVTQPAPESAHLFLADAYDITMHVLRFDGHHYSVGSGDFMFAIREGETGYRVYRPRNSVRVEDDTHFYVSVEVDSATQQQAECFAAMAEYVQRTDFKTSQHEFKRQFNSRFHRAVDKLEDLLAPIGPYFARGAERVVVDIGAAPGAMSYRMASYEGVTQVNAICKPGTNLNKQFHHVKIKQQHDLLENIKVIPVCDLLICDANDIGLEDAANFIQLARFNATYAIFKVQEVFSAQATLFSENGWALVKPRRSNQLSSEVYAINYWHHLGSNHNTLCKQLTKNLRSVNATPLRHPNNMLYPGIFSDFERELYKIFYVTACVDAEDLEAYCKTQLTYWENNRMIKTDVLAIFPDTAATVINFVEKTITGAAREECSIREINNSAEIDENTKEDYYEQAWEHPYTKELIRVKKAGRWKPKTIDNIRGKLRETPGDDCWAQCATDVYKNHPHLAGVPLPAVQCRIHPIDKAHVVAESSEEATHDRDDEDMPPLEGDEVALDLVRCAECYDHIPARLYEEHLIDHRNEAGVADKDLRDF